MTKRFFEYFVSLCILYGLNACGSGGGDGSAADIEYVALGASDAVGIGATPLTNGYVYLIKEGIENSGREVDLENLGIPGAEIGNIDNLELPLLDRDNPELVTLFTGANDLIGGDDAGQFEIDLQSLLKKIKENAGPNVVIVVGNLPNFTTAPRFVENPDKDVTISRIAAFNQAINRQTAAAGAFLVDLSGLPVNDAVTAMQTVFIQTMPDTAQLLMPI
jgi:acyl-CoA thioesterase-1